MAASRSDRSVTRLQLPVTTKDPETNVEKTELVWTEITCGKPKVEIKQEINTRTAANKFDPYEINPGSIEYTLEIPSISQAHLSTFKKLIKEQTKGASISVAIFKYNKKGTLVRDYLLTGVYFESLSQEGNEEFDAKGGAMKVY